MEFSRQDYKSGLPFLSLDYLPDPGIKPESPALQEDSLPLSQGSQWKGLVAVNNSQVPGWQARAE